MLSGGYGPLVFIGACLLLAGMAAARVVWRRRYGELLKKVDALPLCYFVFDSRENIILRSAENIPAFKAHCNQAVLDDLEDREVVALVRKCVDAFRATGESQCVDFIHNGAGRSGILSGLPNSFFGREAFIWSCGDTSRLRRSLEEARRGAEDLRLAFMAAGDGVLMTDRRGVISLLNPVAEELTGWRSGDAAGRDGGEVLRVYSPAGDATAEFSVAAVLRSGIAVHAGDLAELVERYGRRRRISGVAAPICDRDGAVSGAIVIFRDAAGERERCERLATTCDVTEAANAGLRDMLAEQAMLLECMPVSICAADCENDLRYTFCNTRGADLFNCVPEDVVGKNNAELFGSEAAEMSSEIIRTARLAAESGEVRMDVLPYPGKDGVRRIGQFFRKRVTAPGNRKLLLEMMIDVTDREAALGRAEDMVEWLRLTLSSIGDGVISTDADGRVMMMNPVAERMIGVRQAEASGKPHEDVFRIVSSRDDMPMASPVRRSLRTGNIVELANHTDLISMDGRRLHIADSAAPIRDRDGRVIGAILVFRDVSEEYAGRDRLRAALTGLEYASELTRSAYFKMSMKDRSIVISSRMFPSLWPLRDGRAVPPEEVVHPEDLNDFNRRVEELLIGRSESDLLDFRMISDRGSRYMRMKAGVDESEVGEPFLVGVLQDVTELTRKGRELADTMKLLDLVLDTIPVMIFVKSVDDEYRYTVTNRYFEEFMGRSRREIIGHGDCELFSDPEAAGHFRRWDEAVVAGGKMETIIESPLDATGTVRHLRTVKIPFETANGGKFLLGVTADVSDEIRQREQLDDLLNIFEVASQMTRSAAFYVNPFTREVSGSKLLSELWPVRDGKAVPRVEVVHPDDLAVFSEAYDSLACGDCQAVTAEFRCIYFGDVRHYRLQARRESRTDGSTLSIGVVQDVSDIVRSASRLQKSQQLWDLIINALPVSIFAKSIDDDFRYSVANNAFADFVGCRVDEIIGKTDAELFPDAECVKTFAESDHRVAASGEPCNFTERPVDCRGRRHQFQTIKLPAVSLDGGALLLGISLDITDLDNMIRMERVNSEVLAWTVSEADFGNVIEKIADALMSNLHCSRVIFARNFPNGWLSLFHESFAPGLESIRETGIAAHETLWNSHFDRLTENEFIIYEDIHEVPEMREFLLAHPDYPTRSFAAIPVCLGHELIGGLMISYTFNYSFRETDTRLLLAMSNVIALAAIRQRQERSMKESERKNQALLDNISIPLWLYDVDGVVVRTNKAAVLLLGEMRLDDTPYCCKRILGCRRKAVDCPVRRALADGKPHSVRLLRDGRSFLVEARAIMDESSGTINGVVSSFYDITELNRMIANQQVVNECLANLVRESDMHRAIRLSIRKICEHIGADRCYIMQFDTAAKRLSCFIEYAANGRQPLLDGFRNRPDAANPDWESRFVDNALLSFPDIPAGAIPEGLESYMPFFERNDVRSLYGHRIMPNGRLWGYLGLMYEGSVRILQPEEVDFIASIAYCIELMLIRKQYQNRVFDALHQAEEADRAKSMFLASMSHEIRTPLNAVIGFSELLKDGTLPAAEERNYLEAISSSGNALLALINDVLDLSKLEAGQMVFSPVDIDLPALVGEVGQIFQQKLQEKKLLFEPVFPKNFPIISADRLRIRQILFNLIGNAVKFTDSGSVAVRGEFERLESGSGSLTLHVIDTGIGIAEEDQQRIFQMFVQAEARGTRAEHNGTGLGLAICKHMIEKMNGTLSLTSACGRGSDFTVVLHRVPFRERRTDEAGGVAEPLAVGGEPGGSYQGRTVLVVDDVAMNIKVMSAMLARLGVRVITAANAEEALRVLGRERVDFMLTDLWMPGMNGAELAGKIRHSQMCPGLRIAAVTADMENGDNFNMTVFDAVLSKPVTVEKIRRFLAAEGGEQSPSVR